MPESRLQRTRASYDGPTEPTTVEYQSKSDILIVSGGQGYVMKPEHKSIVGAVCDCQICEDYRSTAAYRRASQGPFIHTLQ